MSRLPIRYLVLTGFALACACAARAQAPEPVPPEVAKARTIARLLERGNLAEARVEAEAAVKRFPENATLHRRLSQVRLSEALDADRRLEALFQDATLARTLAIVIDDLENPTTTIEQLKRFPDTLQRRKQSGEALLHPANLKALLSYRDRAEKGFVESKPLLQARSRLLLESFALFKKAGALGDGSTELRLSELWTRAAALLFRKDLEELDAPFIPSNQQDLIGGGPRPDNPLHPLQGKLGELKAAIELLPTVKPGELVREAAEIAKQRPKDAAALAGAADLIQLPGAVTDAYPPDPVRRHINLVLDGLWRPGGIVLNSYSQPIVEKGSEAFKQSAESRDPDPEKQPVFAALKLYREALARDPKFTLPYLRERLVLLTAVYEPEQARKLLDEIERHQPRNSVLAFERARIAFHIDDQGPAGFQHLRSAAQKLEFDRSYLVAAPSVLRPALRFQRRIVGIEEKYWPGYRGFTGLLEQMQHKGAGDKLDLLRLRLLIADRLCTAPDVPDQTFGINEKTRVLNDLLNLKTGLTDEERARFEQLLARHQLVYADYPRKVSMVRINEQGVTAVWMPSLEREVDHGSRTIKRELTVVPSAGGRFVAFGLSPG